MNLPPPGYGSKGNNLAYLLQQFWSHEYEAAHYCDLDPKSQPLPLARIKKVMKSDREVKMISSETPILFAKACEIFISEITIRAWQNAEESRRRTLQRSDVAAALARSDQFDFLIDILPRLEVNLPVPNSHKLQPPSQGYTANNLNKFPTIPNISYPGATMLVTPAIEVPTNSSHVGNPAAYRVNNGREPHTPKQRQTSAATTTAVSAIELPVSGPSTAAHHTIPLEGPRISALMDYIREFN